MRYIKKYQKQHGLVPDGIIGKHTLDNMVDVFGIPPMSLAYFLGQLAEETGYFSYGKENLNYSASGLQKIFSKYFPTWALAKEYAHQPEQIANKVYANRLGNGDESGGDGWKYRGRGAIQLTGKTNYRKFSEAMEDPDILTTPDIVEQKYYWQVALWYFDSHNLWEYTHKINKTNIKTLTKRINGGYNGLDKRIHYTYHFYHLTRLL